VVVYDRCSVWQFTAKFVGLRKAENRICIDGAMQKSSRLKRELENITKSPPPGISCVPKGDSLDVLDASKCQP
jgi:ubiquitin-protein ligase